MERRLDDVSRALASGDNRRNLLKAAIAAIAGATGAAARDGQVAAAQADCGFNETYCGGTGRLACVDISRDSDNCGGCGLVCPRGTTCNRGVCQCAVGAAYCPNSPGFEKCVDVSRDSDNCGGCGLACPRGTTCNGGLCECAIGEVYCPDSPDPTNASTCRATATTAVDVDSRAHAERLARGGCANAPLARRTAPTPRRFDKCVATSDDDENCGGCGLACPRGTFCNRGACECPVGRHLLPRRPGVR